MSRRNREINVFSTSAIDLFASSLGVFIVLVIILFPYFKKTSTAPVINVAELEREIEELKEVIEVLKKENTKIPVLEKRIEELLKNKPETPILTNEEIKKIQNELEKLKREVEKVKELEKTILALRKNTPEKPIMENAAIVKMQKELAKIKEENRKIPTLEKEIEKLKKQIVPKPILTNPQIVELQEKLKRIPILEKEVEDLKRKMLQKPILTNPQIVKLQKELEELKKKIPEKPILSNPEIAQLQKKLEALNQLQKKHDQVKKENEKLKAASAKSGTSFAAVIVQWSTPKHDIDLEIIDPKGRVYNYKKRKNPGSSASFALDSRSGPGAEVWQTNDLVEGTYKIKYKFYNNYGNKSPAKIQTTIFSTKGKYVPADISLDTAGKNESSLKFKIDSAGNVQFL